MASIELRITLPESLAEEARAKGLLDPAALAELLRQELRRQSVDRFFAAAERLRAPGGAVLTPAELELEIETARAGPRNVT